MNYGPLLFLGVFFSLSLSWLGMIVIPQLQIGRQQQVIVEPENYRYPSPRSGAAERGADVYRANGCFYCHTQQVRQDGVKFDVVLVSPGTNTSELIQAIQQVKPDLAPAEVTRLIEQAPKPVLQGLTHRDAASAAKKLSVPDAKVQLLLVPIGPDIERGWGKRMTVPQDYVFDKTVMLGTARIGPDLANIGLRQTNSTWQLLHLYDPQLTSPGSTMPPYRYLFEKRKIARQSSPDALKLPDSAVRAGFEIVPTPEATALVAYLDNLRAEAPLVEAPVPTPPKPPTALSDTNQPPTSATSTNQPGGTNQPPK
jgi:cbb3-type cytochrome oxidase cytochrome c subunit